MDQGNKETESWCVLFTAKDRGKQELSKARHAPAQLPSRVRLFETLRTIARQASLSMGFSRQEYWSGLPCPPPGDLPYPGIEPVSPVSPMLQVKSFPSKPPGSHRFLAMRISRHHVCPYKFQHSLSSHSVHSSKIERFLRPKRSGDINSGNHLPSPHLYLE